MVAMMTESFVTRYMTRKFEMISSRTVGIFHSGTTRPEYGNRESWRPQGISRFAIVCADEG